MKKYYFILLLLYAIVQIKAQPTSDLKRDYVWKMGYGGEITGDPNFKLTTLNFNTTPLNITAIWDTVNFIPTCATVCDSLGQLVFYTNGIFVYDKNDNKMRLDTLNPGYFANRDADFGYNFYQAALILPLPNNPFQYYLFHQRIADPNIDYYPTDGEGLYYTVVDSRLRNGASGVVSWRNLIVRDTLEHGKVNAVRHANGRDWWVTCWHKNYTKYRLCLLDTAGVHDLGWQQVSTALSYSDFGQSCFSPDGSLWAGITYDRPLNRSRIDVMDFDRCTGVLNNRRQFHSISQGYFIGSSISPNSRFLYTSNGRLLRIVFFLCFFFPENVPFLAYN